MAFEIEKVSDTDVDKYGMRETNKKFWVGDFSYEWVIDRDRDCWLRYLRHGDRDTPYENDFSFYWKGTLLHIRFDKRGEGVRDGTGSTTWTFGGWELPESLNPQRAEILAALKEALIAYRDNGSYSSYAHHTA